MLFVHVAAAFSVHVPWLTPVLHATFLPSFTLSRDVMLTIVAVFGTTISPYLFFWQASQEAEDSRLSYRRKYAHRADKADPYFRRIAFDTWSGMLVSNPSLSSLSSRPRRRSTPKASRTPRARRKRPKLRCVW